MNTLKRFLAGLEAIPTATVWLLADLGEAKGKQQLFTKQAPQKLKALREHALIKSAVSSNRIEGVEVPPERIKPALFGKLLLNDRSEEELRGYRHALEWVHREGAGMPVAEASILELRRLSRGPSADGGRYKEKNGDIIEKYPDGRERVRFRTVPAVRTPKAVRELLGAWARLEEESSIPSLVLVAGFNLDFLCIHPFRDGNGRESRLLFLLLAYHFGYEVGRYISLERLIEQNKERYYETLEISSRNWHEGKHDPWPYVNYLLFILKEAYREFESRLGQIKEPRGAKTEVVIAALRGMQGRFRVADLVAACPGVSMDMIRLVLKDLRRDGRVACLGRGKNAEWERRGKW